MEDRLDTDIHDVWSALTDPSPLCGGTRPRCLSGPGGWRRL